MLPRPKKNGSKPLGLPQENPEPPKSAANSTQPKPGLGKIATMENNQKHVQLLATAHSKGVRGLCDLGEQPMLDRMIWDAL